MQLSVPPLCCGCTSSLSLRLQRRRWGLWRLGWLRAPFSGFMLSFDKQWGGVRATPFASISILWLAGWISSRSWAVTTIIHLGASHYTLVTCSTARYLWSWSFTLDCSRWCHIRSILYEFLIRIDWIAVWRSLRSDISLLLLSGIWGWLLDCGQLVLLDDGLSNSIIVFVVLLLWRRLLRWFLPHFWFWWWTIQIVA